MVAYTNMKTRRREGDNEFCHPETNWYDKLPEIDIIPVMKQEEMIEIECLPTDTTGKCKKQTLNALGYKNPFTYTTTTCRPTKPHVSKTNTESCNKWTCMICNEVTANKESLIEHYEQHKNEKDSSNSSQAQNSNIEDYFKCVVCAREFTSSKSYEKHLQRKHGENNYACEKCNKMYKNSLQFCLHNFNYHPNKDGEIPSYKCIVCDFATPNWPAIKLHIKHHENDYQHRCDICDKKFVTAALLENHKSSHTGLMPFQCEICSKSFPYSRYLVAHKKSLHPEMYTGLPSPLNQCMICGKQFAHRKSLLSHVRSHTGENTVLCDICGKSLSSAEHLKQHIRIHTGYKPHVCEVCGKGFAKKSNLTLHERVHSGEKPYICRECGKSFSQRSTLVIHGRYHSGERPYSCPLCRKGFVSKGLLGVHLKSCSRIIQ